MKITLFSLIGQIIILVGFSLYGMEKEEVVSPLSTIPDEIKTYLFEQVSDREKLFSTIVQMRQVSSHWNTFLHDPRVLRSIFNDIPCPSELSELQFESLKAYLIYALSKEELEYADFIFLRPIDTCFTDNQIRDLKEYLGVNFIRRAHTSRTFLLTLPFVEMRFRYEADILFRAALVKGSLLADTQPMYRNDLRKLIYTMRPLFAQLLSAPLFEELDDAFGVDEQHQHYVFPIWASPNANTAYSSYKYLHRRIDRSNSQEALENIKAWVHGLSLSEEEKRFYAIAETGDSERIAASLVNHPLAIDVALLIALCARNFDCAYALSQVSNDDKDAQTPYKRSFKSLLLEHALQSGDTELIKKVIFYGKASFALDLEAIAPLLLKSPDAEILIEYLWNLVQGWDETTETSFEPAFTRSLLKNCIKRDGAALRILFDQFKEPLERVLEIYRGEPDTGNPIIPYTYRYKWIEENHGQSDTLYATLIKAFNVALAIAGAQGDTHMLDAIFDVVAGSVEGHSLLFEYGQRRPTNLLNTILYAAKHKNDPKFQEWALGRIPELKLPSNKKFHEIDRGIRLFYESNGFLGTKPKSVFIKKFIHYLSCATYNSELDRMNLHKLKNLLNEYEERMLDAMVVPVNDDLELTNNEYIQAFSFGMFTMICQPGAEEVFILLAEFIVGKLVLFGDLKKFDTYLKLAEEHNNQEVIDYLIATKSLADTCFQYSAQEQMLMLHFYVMRVINDSREELKLEALGYLINLLDFSIVDPKNKQILEGLIATRRHLVNHFAYGDESTSDTFWRKYFIIYATQI